MAGPLKNEDFLCVSAYIRALESQLLTEADMTRMVDAAEHSEALRVLAEHEYPLMEENMASVEKGLQLAQKKLFEDLSGFQMDSRVFDFFRVRQDYHNVKVLLKSAVTGADPDPLLMSGGRYEADELKRIVWEGEETRLTEKMEAAVREARKTLSATGDAQKSDFILDHGFYAEVLQIAESTGSTFLKNYVQLMIDADNAKALIRVTKMMKDADLFKSAVIPGGTVDETTLMNAAQNGAITEPFQGTAFASAVETIAPIIHSGTLTAFERVCDDVMTDYLRQAALIPYGIEPVVAYISAKQREIQNIRIIMSGRFAGLRQQTIRERMREAYV